MDTLVTDQRAVTRWLPLTRRQRTILITVCLLLGDCLSLVVSFSLAYWFRFNLLPYFFTNYTALDYIYIISAIIPLWLFIFALSQLYHPRTLFGGLDEYIKVFYSITIGIFLVVLFGFLQRDDLFISRGWLLISWSFSLFFVTTFRFIFRRIIFNFRSRGHLLSPAVIVGANEEGIAMAQQLQQASTSGLYIAGFIDNTVPLGKKVFNSFTVLGDFDELEELINRHQIEELIIASSGLDKTQLLRLFQKVTLLPDVNIRLSSGLFELATIGMRIKELAYVPLIEVDKYRISGLDAAIKSLLDYAVTILLLMFLWPIFFLIALIVVLDSPGPAIYRRRVIGVNGREFDALKFRTMISDNHVYLENNLHVKDTYDKEYKLKQDPRITRVGAFLRQWSLDELPQLLNVLKGQMSLVGPRMISPPEMKKYGKWGLNLLSVKPGLTGLWQVSGRSDLNYEERVRLDMQYIRNWNIWQDIYILLATIPAVFSRKGAY